MSGQPRYATLRIWLFLSEQIFAETTQFCPNFLPRFSQGLIFVRTFAFSLPGPPQASKIAFLNIARQVDAGRAISGYVIISMHPHFHFKKVKNRSKLGLFVRKSA
ncbi:hypothetical protein BDP27DRAFT_1329256 [Rhodocollybia butyracea]|uniref:Secreted protein n=1 Tax=Rhodocollybia butyracea TaxID=206335 RepID=A0A9P5PKG5_9AGAR|nr:hypothetical protein BDP27DRAFT_1329256 [Rhodocollybia butyracea]